MALVQRLIVLGILIAWGPLANATVGDTAKIGARWQPSGEWVP